MTSDGATNDASTSNFGIGCLAIVAVVAVLGGGWWFYSNVLARPAGAPHLNDIEAYTYCDQAVQKRLKAPSTARFMDQEATYSSAADRWTATGVVESDNSFGVPIQTGYQCTIIDDGDQADYVRVDWLEEIW